MAHFLHLQCNRWSVPQVGPTDPGMHHLLLLGSLCLYHSLSLSSLEGVKAGWEARKAFSSILHSLYLFSGGLWPWYVISGIHHHHHPFHSATSRADFPRRTDSDFCRCLETAVVARNAGAAAAGVVFHYSTRNRVQTALKKEPTRPGSERRTTGKESWALFLFALSLSLFRAPALFLSFFLSLSLSLRVFAYKAEEAGRQ